MKCLSAFTLGCDCGGWRWFSDWVSCIVALLFCPSIQSSVWMNCGWQLRLQPIVCFPWLPSAFCLATFGVYNICPAVPRNLLDGGLQDSTCKGITMTPLPQGINVTCIYVRATCWFWTSVTFTCVNEHWDLQKCKLKLWGRPLHIQPSHFWQRCVSVCVCWQVGDLA